jgi:hypothetical protein
VYGKGLAGATQVRQKSVGCCLCPLIWDLSWTAQEARQKLAIEGGIPWWPGCWDEDEAYHCHHQ